MSENARAPIDLTHERKRRRQDELPPRARWKDAIREDQSLSPVQVHVAMAIADHIEKWNRTCIATNERLMQDTHLTESTIEKARRVLIARGYLVRVRAPRRGQAAEWMITGLGPSQERVNEPAWPVPGTGQETQDSDLTRTRNGSSDSWPVPGTGESLYGPSTTTTTGAPESSPTTELENAVVVVAKIHNVKVNRTRRLKSQCERIGRAGWTTESLTAWLNRQGWSGVQGGGVVTWLERDLPAMPPEPTPKRQDCSGCGGRGLDETDPDRPVPCPVCKPHLAPSVAVGGAEPTNAPPAGGGKGQGEIGPEIGAQRLRESVMRAREMAASRS